MFRGCNFPPGNKASSLGRSLLLLGSLCLTLGLATIRPAQAQLTDQVLHSFGQSDGDQSYTSLLQSSIDGNYYGTTEYGGGSGVGTVFKIDGSGHLTTIFAFNYSNGAYPQGDLTQGPDGTIYGTTDGGGSSGYGTVFRINPDGTGFQTLHNFTYYDGGLPFGNIILASDGMLYTTTWYGGPNSYGVLAQLSTDGSVFNVVHGFNYYDGYQISGNITEGRDGMIYGTANAGGANGDGDVWVSSKDGTVFADLHDFSYGDGSGPYGGVQQGSGSDNSLYGSAWYGGANGYGLIFKMNTDGSGFTDLHDFNGTDGNGVHAGLHQGSDGLLYGETFYGGVYGVGNVFGISTDGSVFNDVHDFNPSTDGSYPIGGVIMGSDGNLHGTTFNSSYASSNYYAGTIYSVSPAGTGFTTVFDFANGFHDGINPSFGTLALGKDGDYYGVTYGGGSNGYGTLYKIDPHTGQVALLHAFTGYDGAGPYNAVTFDKSGNIYGTTSYGGVYGGGNIWKYDPTTGNLTDLFDLGGAAGFFVTSNVVVSGTKLYGSGTYGGAFDWGAIWVLNLPTATKPETLTILHSFNYSDGAFPFGQLIMGSDKNIYGCCNGGGDFGYGTIFQITPKGKLTTLHSLNGSTDGSYPNSGVIEAPDGMLYAGTYLGGANGDGTAYQVSMDGSVFNVLHTFNGTDGSGAVGQFRWGSDRMLYGTTYSGGANGGGTLFNLSTDGTVFNSLYSFGASSTDGNTPFDGPAEGADGNMYLATDAGGIFGGGTAVVVATELPLIKSVSPTSGSETAHTTMTIKGTNLAFASVTIGGVAQTVLSSSATQVKFTLTTGTPTGSQTVVVTTPHGTGYSPKTITVNP